MSGNRDDEGNSREKILEMEKRELSDDCSSVDKHHQQCYELLIDIDEESLEPPLECCIYRVPKHLREVKAEAYTPLVVSIGPLHHGKPELASMEKHKKRFAKRCRKRIGLDKWKSLETFVKDNEKKISNCYEDTLEFKSHEFVEMVLLDAVFIMEYLLREFLKDQSDFLQDRVWLKFAISRDFLLLENQLPYFLLDGLYTLACGVRIGNDESPPFLTLSSKFFWFPFMGLEIKNLEGTNIQNFTDLIRHACLNSLVLSDKPTRYLENLPSAVKLHESGIKFKSITKGFMLDIKFVKRKKLIPLFEVCELHMPRFAIEGKSECYIRNVMALEQCHYSRHTHFCNFIDLLDNLINTKKDVEFLVEKGILQNFVGDPRTLTGMINKLMLNIEISDSCFIDVADNLKKHYMSPWNRAKATLINVYFSNPWRATSTVAAVILLLLTLAQTVLSILQVVQPPV